MLNDVKAKKLALIYDELYKLYGDCECPLNHETPFQLLVAVILSAQCTDKRVNMTTVELFKRFPDAASLSKADLREVEEIIKSIGLTKAKSKNIVATAQAIVEKFNGEVPQTMEELITLPGVGRKTANAVLPNAFGKPGFAVDTHVKRLLNRMGIVKSDDPVKIEIVINKRVAPEKLGNFSHLLIWHGRNVCHANKKFDCEKVCVLNNICAKKKNGKKI